MSLLLIDATGLLVRSERAGRDSGMTAEVDDETILTGPLFLFIRSVCGYLREHKPDYALAAWDGPDAAGWRRGQYPLYKANRPPPPDHDSAYARTTWRFLDALGIAQMRIRGFEGDDLISWACWRASHEETGDILIRSDDADLHQLLGFGTIQFGLGGNSMPMTGGDIIASYGVTAPALPKFRAIAGDRSDNIPGMPGIGPKTAVKLLQRAQWQLEGISHKSLDGDDHLRQALATYRRILDLSERREDLDRCINRDGASPYSIARACQWKPGEAVLRARRIFEKYDMESLVRALDNGRLW